MPLEPARVVPYGEFAFLILGLEQDSQISIASSLRSKRLTGVTDVVPAQQSIAVLADPLVCDMDRLGQQLSNLVQIDQPELEHKEVVIAVCYDGLDLQNVAAIAGLDEAEVIRRHTQSAFKVSYLGFVPGFAYLSGLDPVLRVPRLADPRVSVPAGSVAIADAFGCVYPISSPGGWQILGTTETVLFDAEADSPALLAPGDRVRFVER